MLLDLPFQAQAQTSILCRCLNGSVYFGSTVPRFHSWSSQSPRGRLPHFFPMFHRSSLINQTTKVCRASLYSVFRTVTLVGDALTIHDLTTGPSFWGNTCAIKSPRLEMYNGVAQLPRSGGELPQLYILLPSPLNWTLVLGFGAPIPSTVSNEAGLSPRFPSHEIPIEAPQKEPYYRRAFSALKGAYFS